MLAAGKLREEEIEKIVAPPQLFLNIQAKIEAEKSLRKMKANKVFVFPRVGFLNWQKAGLAFAALVIGIFGLTFFLVNTPEQEIARKAVADEKPPQSAFQTDQYHPEKELPPIENAPEKEFQPQRIPSLKMDKREKFKSSPSVSQKRAPKQKRYSPPKSENQASAPFIALTFAGDFADDDERRIVRVELSPAHLLALGVAVQTENESETIKTDLLVGSDGVTRAIRIVK